MTHDETHEDMAGLVAAFAMDAIDADEREAVETHLRACPRCAADLVRYREALSHIVVPEVDPADELWSKIVHSTTGRVDSGGHAAWRPQPRAMHRLLGTAAAVIALVGTGYVAGTEQDEHAPSVAAAADAAAAASDHRTVALISPDGGRVAEAIVLDNGEAFLRRVALPRLDKGTYQLWAIRQATPISVAILGQRPGVSAFQIGPDVEALAISIEDDPGGAVAPIREPIAIGALER